MRGAGQPIWDDIASAEQLDALSPPRREHLPERPDVLVVGGGVVGLAVAAFCSDAGMEVLLVEREQRLASCSSGRAAGGLGPDCHPELGPRWREAAHRSLELHRELNNEMPYGLRTVDVSVLPDLVIPDQGHVDPLRFCAALASRTLTIATGCAYEELSDVRAAHTVFATGAAPDDARIDGQSFVKGHLVATVPVEPLFDGMIGTGRSDILVLQLPSGHVIAGGTKEPSIEAPDIDEDVVRYVADEMVRAVPALEDVPISHRWTCFRPLIPDALPIAKRIREDVWCVAGLYSTGILMAPLIGYAIATAIDRGADAEPLFD